MSEAFILDELAGGLFPHSATQTASDYPDPLNEEGRQSSKGNLPMGRNEEAEFLSSLFEVWPDGTIVVELDGRVSYINAAGCLALKVESPFAVLGEEWTSFWPADAVETAQRAFSTATAGRPETLDLLRSAPQGGSTWWDVLLTPVLRDGRVQRVLCVTRDVTERRQAEQRAALLISESHHRVKNTLATVQAVARSTVQSSDSLAEFEVAFRDRLLALANTHDLLMRDDSDAADLERLLRSELNPYSDATRHNVQLLGPKVTLPAEIAVPFGMIVHELTTNAAKYGALSVQAGSVQLAWSVWATDGQRRLRLTWTEIGGPKVASQTRRGFGSQLLERLLRGHMPIAIQREFAADGLRAEIEVILP